MTPRWSLLWLLLVAAPLVARGEGPPNPPVTPPGAEPKATQPGDPRPAQPPAATKPAQPADPKPAGDTDTTAPAVSAAQTKPVQPDLRAGQPELDLPKSDVPEYAQEELGLGWALLRTVLVLGAVIALAYLTLNVGLRRLLGIRATPSGRSLVTVLERVPLDPKRALFVVKAANEVLLIGGSETSLELITRLDAAEVEKLRAETGSPPALKLSPFLQKLLGRKDAPPPPASS